MWTVICDHSNQELDDFVVSNGSKSPHFHSYISGTDLWCTALLQDIPHHLSQPHPCIQMMLKRKAVESSSTQEVVDAIVDVILKPEIHVSFIGRCCTELDDASESVASIEDTSLLATHHEIHRKYSTPDSTSNVEQTHAPFPPTSTDGTFASNDQQSATQGIVGLRDTAEKLSKGRAADKWPPWAPRVEQGSSRKNETFIKGTTASEM